MHHRNKHRGKAAKSRPTFTVAFGLLSPVSRHRVLLALYNMEKPVIAAVRGPVYGIAAAFVLACDLILASDTTKFSMAFKKVGMVSSLVADDELESEAHALAKEMAESAVYALALTKKMFQSTAMSTLEMALETEAMAATLTRLPHDHKEAVSA